MNDYPHILAALDATPDAELCLRRYNLHPAATLDRWVAYVGIAGQNRIVGEVSPTGDTPAFALARLNRLLAP